MRVRNTMRPNPLASMKSCCLALDRLLLLCPMVPLGDCYSHIDGCGKNDMLICSGVSCLFDRGSLLSILDPSVDPIVAAAVCCLCSTTHWSCGFQRFTLLVWRCWHCDYLVQRIAICNHWSWGVFLVVLQHGYQWYWDMVNDTFLPLLQKYPWLCR